MTSATRATAVGVAVTGLSQPTVCRLEDTVAVLTKTPGEEACRLCEGPGALRNSHIVPEFLYEGMYDEIHRALRMNPLRDTLRLEQKGVRDRLLCDACEQLLNERYEKPFLRMWRDSGLPPGAMRPGDVLQVEDVVYETTKLFLLSVLWRASVSRVRGFRVDLGPHREAMREAVLSGQLPQGDPYPIVGVFVVDGVRVIRCVGAPAAQRIDGHRTVSILMGGCEWTYFVSRHRAGLVEGIGLLPEGKCLFGATELARSRSVNFVRAMRGRRETMT